MYGRVGGRPALQQGAASQAGLCSRRLSGTHNLWSSLGTLSATELTVKDKNSLKIWSKLFFFKKRKIWVINQLYFLTVTSQ